MTQEEKQLLLTDLCARLPYGIKITCFKNGALTPYLIDFRDSTIHATSDFSGTYIKVQLEDCKIYLRPMSSMTEEEIKEYESIFSIGEYSCGGSLEGEEYEYINDSYDDVTQSVFLIDWLLAHHFDFRGLIEKGLALEATEGMYKTE